MEKMKVNHVWGQDIYDYIRMCDQMGKESSKNWVLGFNGPVGIGKKHLIRTICNEIQRRFVCIRYEKFIECGYSLIEETIIEKDRESLLFYVEETLIKDFNYTKELGLLVEFIRNHKKIENCIFVFSSTAIMGSNSAIDVNFRVFRYGCLSLDEKIELAHDVVCECQHQWDLEDISLPDMSIEILIKHYTKESGINYLSALIRNLYEAIYFERNYRNRDIELTDITNKTIYKILGSGCYVYDEQISNRCVQGIGMAWTRWGGELLPIQIEMEQGNGQIIYSGNVGDLMKESVEVVFQYMKLNYKAWHIPRKEVYRNNFYISIYELGLYKDGASAGLAFLVKLICTLKRIKFKQAVAFSGEVSLDGRVLRVGGLKEKINAVQMHGIQKVVLPRQSWPEYQALPDNMRKSLCVYFINDVSELVKIFIREQED